MFEKVKGFYQKHKTAIIITVGGAAVVVSGILIGKHVRLSRSDISDITSAAMEAYDDSADRAFLEGIGAVYKDGYSIPFATKDVATKFLEEVGNSYQVEILDDTTSVIWIGKEG